MRAPIDRELPSCPVPGHGGSHVVLGGWYGNAGRRRRLFVCDMPKDGSTAKNHRFAELLPRNLSSDSRALPADLDDDYALLSARNYQFTAHEVATALVEVGRGVSYSEASLRARQSAARRRGNTLRGGRHGSLVSDWVEVYAEALFDAQMPFRESWPDTVLVGSRAVRTRSGLAFAVLAAATHLPGGDLVFLALRTAGGTDASSWTTFLRALAAQRPGAPSRIIGDGGRGLSRAVDATWPVDAPALWTDEHRLRREGRQIIQHAGLAHRDERLWRAALVAWRSTDDWDTLLAEAGRYRVPALDRWLALAGPTMAMQFAARHEVVHRSGLPLERALDEAVRRLGPRSGAQVNRERTDRLLSLVALDLSGLARVNTCTAQLCEWLARGGGRPTTSQRSIAAARGSVRSRR